MIRLYGVMKGNASWARVTAGMIEGIRSLDKLAGTYDLHDVNVDTEGSGLGAGYNAPVGVCVGPPSTASIMRTRGEHRHRLMMIAANSTWLPQVMMAKTNRLVTGYLAPSRWAAGVIARYADGLPVYVWHHGVDVGFSPTYAHPGAERIKVLHLASTHMDRKGTRELIHAWCKVIKNDSAGYQLNLIVDGPENHFKREIELASQRNYRLAQSIMVRPRQGLSIEEARKLYCKHHLVCQPSRGEGWGLCPLESRACGTPVVATACTGHQDHMESLSESDGVVVIPHGLYETIDDGPGATAPSITVDGVAEALATGFRRVETLWENAQDKAQQVRQQWSWSTVTAQFLHHHEKDLLG
jgi:glycosyltransferase involved in cell wall biosynthesis